MAIIRNIDAARNHEFIMEDLDDETCLVKETKLDELKRLLKDVCNPVPSVVVILHVDHFIRKSKTSLRRTKSPDLNEKPSRRPMRQMAALYRHPTAKPNMAVSGLWAPS